MNNPITRSPWPICIFAANWFGIRVKFVLGDPKIMFISMSKFAHAVKKVSYCRLFVQTITESSVTQTPNVIEESSCPGRIPEHHDAGIEISTSIVRTRMVKKGVTSLLRQSVGRQPIAGLSHVY